MKKMVGIIQEHMYTHNDIKIFEAGIRKIYQEHYDPNESLNVLWMVMPKGYAYSERKLSEATVIVIEVDADITQASTISADFYNSPQVFEDVKESIFARSWQCIGLTSDLTEPESAQ